MPPSRTLLIVGSPGRDAVRAVVAHAREASFTADVAETAEEARVWLEQQRADAVLVGPDATLAEAMCMQLRMQAEWSDVPVLRLVRQFDDLMFPDTFAWGGDDVVRLDALHQLVPRLRGLPAHVRRVAGGATGKVVVAGIEPRRRVVTGRVLRNAGWDVRFAADMDEALAGATDPTVSLVVCEDDTPTDGVIAVADAAIAAGSKATFVVMVDPKHLAEARADAARHPQVTVVDAYAPPENVLFVANELLRTQAGEARASARLLYGTTVAFRVAGRGEDMVGFSYNLSAGGLYVRTLACLSRGDEAWVELTPPRSDRRVRLVAKVAWHRPFGPNDVATVPPGFGVQFVDGAGGDLDRYRTGYDTLYADVLGRAA